MNYENTEGCRIIQAGFQEQTLQVVRTITRETIQEIYPHYYPKGAVDLFLSHHNDAGNSSGLGSRQCLSFIE